MPGPLLAVDAPSLLYRAFYALPKTITDDAGTPVNALLGVSNLVLQAVEKHSPRAVVLCFGEEAAHYRVELYPTYHADRIDMPAELVPQWSDAAEFFGAFNWLILRHETLEADDLLGAYARLEAASGGEALVMTGDRDMFQCATDAVTILYVKTGSKGAEVIDPEGVRARYGIEPAQVPDFIALRGDPSDGIPGAKGIGEKTAAELLTRHGSLDAVLEGAVRESKPSVRKALLDDPDQLRRYREIATLQEVEVELPSDQPLDGAGAAAAARARGMNRLAERLEGLA
jgi:DNA polymerase-1